MPIGRVRHHSDARIDQSSVGLSSRFLSSSFFLPLSFSRSPLHLDTVPPPPLSPPVLLDFFLSSRSFVFVAEPIL